MRKKYVLVAYLFYLISFHYIYLRRDFGWSLFYWLTAGGFTLLLFHDFFFLPRVVRNENISVMERRKLLASLKPGKTYTYNSTNRYANKRDWLVQDMVKWGYLAKIEKRSNLFDYFCITEKGIRMQREIKNSNY